MPRFLVERSFPDGLRIPMNDEGAVACGAVVDNNARSGVTWIHSYVSEDLQTTYCIYDGPSADSIREAAGSNNLPIDRISPVRVLNPYFYR
ncbi:MAG: DUF4242 domain-containing protein [Luteimonas sp.]